MFIEEWQLFETPFLEPLKGIKDMPIDEGEVDFFNFEDPLCAQLNYDNNSNNINDNNNDVDEINYNESNGAVEDFHLPTPESESGNSYAPLSDSAVSSQATPVDLSLRSSFSGSFEAAAGPLTAPLSRMSSSVGLNEQVLDQDYEYEDEQPHDAAGVIPRKVTSAQRYVKQPRQNRYSNNTVPKGRRVSESRLSAQGLAEVLKLDSPEEALKRERFILDIFETELHYPLGYKTWVRDTSKDYRLKLIDQLYDRVKDTYPEYDRNVLETIIRRATYYIMQSRLRRERRARAKSRRASSSSS